MKFIKYLLAFSLCCIVLGVGAIVGMYYYVQDDLPAIDTLKDVQLQTPMQVYSKDGKLISQFGEKRRIPLKLEEMPPHLLEAIIATEDSRYYDHPGIDPIGIARAAIVVATSGSAKQGASTITQQLARNFFLSNEKKIMRKIKEIFLALRIEQMLSKDEILELYLNKIYLGHRSYGVGAAAQVYFGKEVKDLTLSEIAVISGLPKAPSTMNPIYSVDRATTRRNVVLMRMLDEKYITREEYDEARAEPIVARYHGAEIQLSAPYVAELARAWMVERYGEDAYTSGMKVYTTVDSNLQQAAQTSAVNNLLAYDMRHGYRGEERVLWQEGQAAWDEEQIQKQLRKVPTYGTLLPAVVTEINGKTAQVYVKNHGPATLGWDGIKWARKFITDTKQGAAPKDAGDVLAAGEQVWVREVALPVTDEQLDQQYAWHLSQVPAANTAFVAMNPENGSVDALVGGFNFVHSKFNRATQSVRQVGSSIKPFIYAAALDKGLTLASLINDAPINQWDKSQGTAWRPKNSPPTYVGPTRLRIGLAQSKNVMAVRVLREVGLDQTRQYLTRFGFSMEDLPRSETIALGAGSLTPIKMAQGYSVFANGGYYVEPFYINRVEGPYGDLEFEASPKTICRSNCQQASAVLVENTTEVSQSATLDAQMANEFDEQDLNSKYAPQVITEQNAFLVREMLYSNVWGGGDWRHGTGWNGTGWRGQALKRRDVGGKTGTTNDSKDAWYNGFAPGMVAIAWVGFDTHDRTLGRTSSNKNLGKEQITGAEAGAKTAQPAWVDFMHTALESIPPQRKKVPNGIVKSRIDRATGLLTHKNDHTSMFEYFEKGTEPTEYVKQNIGDTIYSQDEDGEELF
ncbi:PBP1A family penicillin-binding protein [Vibrio sp. SCSIO 43136]|uniref:penicillin-binding protein 1A n=1 Tax=Vibrio sp. SCSIO 43136 TaxID=2819101 RepID=UPI0020763676|nr:PBP1A family penicillin-binding protein [Vibrio sp. SCSIO 43136]USD65495.1 PBP1A family penicillin-binding protein [Vibrio sp. SCSIO 43136]